MAIHEDEDLGLKIGTEEEAFWTEVLENTEKDLERIGKLMKLSLATKKMCEERIADENSDSA